MPVSQRVICEPSARHEAHASHPQRVPEAIRPDGVQSGVQQRDLEAAARRGIPELRRGEIFADAGDGTDALGHAASSGSRRCS